MHEQPNGFHHYIIPFKGRHRVGFYFDPTVVRNLEHPSKRRLPLILLVMGLLGEYVRIMGESFRINVTWRRNATGAGVDPQLKGSWIWNHLSLELLYRFDYYSHRCNFVINLTKDTPRSKNLKILLFSSFSSSQKRQTDHGQFSFSQTSFDRTASHGRYECGHQCLVMTNAPTSSIINSIILLSHTALVAHCTGGGVRLDAIQSDHSSCSPHYHGSTHCNAFLALAPGTSLARHGTHFSDAASTNLLRSPPSPALCGVCPMFEK